MNKLTNEEIARVFLMYLGQNVDTATGWSGGGYGATYKDITLSNIEMHVLNMGSYLNNPKESNERRVQISLTPLPAITDEHAIKVAELVNDEKYIEGETFEIVKEDERISVYSSKIEHSNASKLEGYRYETRIYTDCYITRIRAYSETIQMPYEAYQYLIQQGYAVPLFFGIDHWANGKTAIELGIAESK